MATDIDLNTIATRSLEEALSLAREEGRVSGYGECAQFVLTRLATLGHDLASMISNPPPSLPPSPEETTLLIDLGFMPKTAMLFADNGFETVAKYLAAKRWQLNAIDYVGSGRINAFNRKMLSLGLHPTSCRT